MTKDESDAPTHAKKEVENSKVPHEATPTHQIHSFERRRESLRWSQTSRYENRFNVYCFSCSNFGHKDMDYRSYGRRSAGSPNDKDRCWTCNHHGHIAANCHTMRCYSCSFFGHKAQECPSQRSQPRRNPSYTSPRRTNESWNKYIQEKIEYQKTNNLSQGHSKVWVRKNILLDLNEVEDQCIKDEDGCHMARQT